MTNELSINSRNISDLVEIISKTSICICGCGGIGSNVARQCIQSGFLKIRLIDYDTVDITNLNRQFFNNNDIGKNKVDALKNNLLAINPHAQIETFKCQLSSQTIKPYTKDYQIIVEGFDCEEDKAMLVHTLASNKQVILAANGMAGLKSASAIKTYQVSENLYMCGDFYSNINTEEGIMSSQVNLVASHIVNKIIEIIAGSLNE